MQVSIIDGVQQTEFFGAVLCIVFLCTFFIKKNYTSLSLTQELKGFAILSIIFAHIGYVLSANHDFLFPFSIVAGVSVNLFLFLSGYGLTYSQLKREETVVTFYKRRLIKLFIPFWIVLGTLVVSDAVVLGKTYTVQFLLQALSGIFVHVNAYTDLNSPFWYFSFIFFYYLLFPLVFSKKWPWLSAGVLYLAVYGIVQLHPSFLSGVIGLYEVHMFAFPLGVFSAWCITTQQDVLQKYKDMCTTYRHYLYLPSLVLLLWFIGYFSIHANVGKAAYLEDTTSLCVMYALILLFMIKKRESKLFSIFGLYSYEIYLFHWPLLYRYDFLYTHVPPWIATLLYLGVFILLAKLLQKCSSFVSKKASS